MNSIFYDYEIKTITIESPEYPQELLEIKEPPQKIYYMGNIELLKRRCIAIVGTRKASQLGRELSFSFAKNLNERDLSIVSGLASRHRWISP